MQGRKPLSQIADETLGVQPRKPLSDIVDAHLLKEQPVQQNIVPVEPEEHGFASGFTSALQGQPRMYAEGMKAYGDVSGIDAIGKLGQKIDESATKTPVKTLTWSDIDNPSEVVDWLAERVGEGAGSGVISLAAGLSGAGIGAGIGAAAAGPAGAATGATVGGLTFSAADALTANIGELRAALIQEGVDEKTASQYAVPYGSILSVPDVAVMGKVLSKFGITAQGKDAARQAVIQKIRDEIAQKQYMAAGKKLAKETGRDITEVAGMEAATEFGQTLGQQGVVANVADKPFFSPQNTEEAVTATVSGLFGGGIMAAPGASVSTGLTTPNTIPDATQGLQDSAEVPPPPIAATPAPNRDSLASAIERGNAQTPPPTAPQTNAPPVDSDVPSAEFDFGSVSQGDTIQNIDENGEIITGKVQGVQRTKKGVTFQILDENGEIHTIFEGIGQTSLVQAAPQQTAIPVEIITEEQFQRETGRAPTPLPTRDDLAAAINGQPPQSEGQQNKADDIAAGMKGMAGGIVDSFYQGFYDRLARKPGASDSYKANEPRFQEMREAFDAGKIKSVDDLKNLLQSPPQKPEVKLSDLGVEDLQKRLTNIRNQAKLQGWDKRLTKLRDDLEAAIAEKNPVAAKVEEITSASEQINPEPTDAQKEAGNYAKGHISISGLNVSLENAKGSTRRGTNSNGQSWEVQMPAHYGYVKGTKGADGDQVDVYVGDNPESDTVFVVDQIDSETRDFDEHKAMLGFSDIQQAMNAYNAAFSDGKGEQRTGGVTIMSMDEFKGWLNKRGATKKPLQYVKPEQQKPTVEEISAVETPQTQEPVQAEVAPPQEQAKPEEPAAAQEQKQPRKGIMGDRLAAGEIVLTSTGRKTTPFPKIALGSPRSVTLTEKRVEEWLMQNALDEARARGDDFNATQFEANLKKPSQADKDSAESYLFDPDFVFDVPKPLLKDVTTPAAQEESAPAPEKTPKPEPKPKPLSKKEKAAQYTEALGLYYQKGNVVRSYYGYDRVIDYTPEPFSVTVEEVKRGPDGNTWQTVGQPRNHSTYPQWANVRDYLIRIGRKDLAFGTRAETTTTEKPGEAQDKIPEQPEAKAEESKISSVNGSATKAGFYEAIKKQGKDKTLYVFSPEEAREIITELNKRDSTLWGNGIGPTINVFNYYAKPEDGISFSVQDSLRKNIVYGEGIEEFLFPKTTQPTPDQQPAVDKTPEKSETVAEPQQDDTENKQPASSEQEKPKSERGKKMQDVGEKMEGKRAFQSRMEKAKPSEKAKEIINSTKKSVAFNIQEKESQTDGVKRFGQALVKEFEDFSAYLYTTNYIQKSGRGRWSTKFPSWDEQVKSFFSDNALTDGLTIEYRKFDPDAVKRGRELIEMHAQDYIELGARINDIFNNSDNIEQLKNEFRNALADQEFEKLFEKFSKSYSLKRDIFSSYSYTTFGQIQDGTKKRDTTRAKPMVRPKLEHIERDGLKDYRRDRNITAQEFKDTFGFRGVEFGEWVNAKEGQAHVNHAYDALMDLADHIGIKPVHISLGGKLGFAFGSRGSGEHAAHYEPATNVINLTKTKGDGSVAHEWMHALDYNIRANDTRHKEFMDLAYKSLSKKMRDVSYLERTLKDFLNGKIWYDGRKSHGVIGNARIYLEYVIKNPIKQLGQSTDFKRDGDALGKDYEGTEVELIARAWESYVHDTLAGKSPYLVNGWVAEGVVTKQNGYRGTLYPEKEERQAFNTFFKEFLNKIEFTDTGVKLKDGAKLPIELEMESAIQSAKEFLPKLSNMLEEINGSTQQNTVSPSVPEGDGPTSPQNVSGFDTVQEDGGTSGSDQSGGDAVVPADGAIPQGEARDDGRSQERSGGNDNQPDDTIPAGEKQPVKEFQASGTNHKIAVGSLDEKRGQKQKAKDNIEIIKLVKKIESEGRAATPQEQTLLAKYTGWGSIKTAFPKADGTMTEGWSDINQELKSLLTDKEYKEARKSIQFAHYTSEIVVRNMWEALSHIGFKSGFVFEPGMGIGNFVGMIPDKISATYSGIELDPMTARIANILYPESSVRNVDFIETRYADNMFDAAIGNPPFSDQIVRSDPKYRKDALSLHNYFFAKAIDMVANGGVVAFVTSRYSLDNLDSSAREKMAEKVDLVGAIRLPNTAFKTNANTEVVTDVIFLRKRLPGEKSNGVSWTKTKPVELLDKYGNPFEIPINEYFVSNPEMVLGNMALSGSMYRQNEFTVEPAQERDLDQQMKEAIARLPENIVGDIQKANTEAMDMMPPEKKEGSYYIKNGNLMQVDGGIGMAVELRGKGVVGGISKQDEAKIKMLIPIRDSLREAMSAMVENNKEEMQKHQKSLAKHYDAFVKKYGPVTKSVTETRPPTPAQYEDARNEIRNDYLAADMEFDEGDIDLTNLLNAINPETGKKYTSSAIAKIREQKRQEIEAAGGIVNQGSFDPSVVPDNVSVTYENLDSFKLDPEYYNLLILEEYNDETGTYKKTDVFDKNIVAQVKKPEIKTPVDALNYSLAIKNSVDIDFMATELGKNADAIIQELTELDLIYALPKKDGTQKYVYSEEYLSGYVKDKLAYAKQIAKTDPEYQRNVRALEAVQPKDVPASDINTNLGSPYFGTKVIQDFMKEELGISANITYTGLVNIWEVEANDPYSPANTTQYGTSKKPAHQIIAHLLMKKDIRITTKNEDGKEIVNVAETQAAQDKAKIIQEKFTNWIWKSSHGEAVFRKYNDEYNNIVARKFDGSHITTAISPFIRLRQHQKNVIWRILQTGNTYMAHAVGAGKTLAMVSAGMEMRRMGIWKKPVYVVPNHMLAQFSGEFRAAYPQAKIFVADEQNFHTDKRRRFVANVAKGDWDGVVMTYSSFKKIPISASFEQQAIETELEKYRATMTELKSNRSGRGTTASIIEKQIQKLESKLKALKVEGKDQSFSFEQLGIDAILLDEAHYFRKLSFVTRQGNMKGVNPIGSKAAWDLYIKSRYLDTVHPNKNLVMASGTPLTNTLAEVFTIQRFMNERALNLRGINNFDAWSAVYANAVSNPERQPSGAYKVVTRLAEFMNLASLSQMTREFMDTVTSDELGTLVDRPTMKTGRMIIKTVKPSREYLAFQKYLAFRTQQAAKQKTGEKGADNILAIIGEGRHAAIDMRLIDPTLPETESKLEDMIDNVFNIWKQTSSDVFKMRYRGDDRESKITGGTQLIFSDLGVRSRTKDGKSFSAYDQIKRKLIKNGVPANQIAFIADYDTTEDKRRLQKMVNDGEIRILIGTTAKMGTGLNVQNRLKAVHNLDAPWLPADLEQRVGRALRQGNQYKEIEIYGYGTEGSYDSTMWGMLETKAKAIIQFLKGDSDLSSMRDIEETDHFRMAKAMTSGDPRVLKQAELQSEVEKLARQSNNFYNEQIQIKNKINSNKTGIERAEKMIGYVQEALKKRVPFKDDEFLMTVMGKPYAERAEASEVITKSVQDIIKNGTSTPSNGIKIGEIQGFDIHMFVSNNTNLTYSYEIFLNDPALKDQGRTWEAGKDSFSGSGLITSLLNSINRMEKSIDSYTYTIEANTRDIKALESQISGEFPKAQELSSKRDELSQIEKDLHANAPVEVIYDDYPIQYWEENKEALKAKFSIVSDEEFYFVPAKQAKGALAKKNASKRQSVQDAINKHLSKIGFPEANVVVFDPSYELPKIENEEGKRYEGVYHNGIVYISLEAKDPIATLNHEVVHALKDAGAIERGEWARLTSMAGEWRKKYNVDENYKKLNLSEEALNEEGIAHAIGDRSQKGLVERIRNKIIRFLNAIRDFLLGSPYQIRNIDDLNKAIMSGELAQREGVQERLAKKAKKFDGLSDVEEGNVMFSLSEKPSEALAQASENLQEARRGKKTFKKDLRKFAAIANHPSQIASLLKEFTPVYLLSLDMQKERDVIIHNLNGMIDTYNNLKEDSKKRVNAVLEIGRLTETNLVPIGGRVVATNKGIDTARHSKDGDTVSLSELETQAYIGVRSAMDKALDMYMEVALLEYGFADEGIKNKSDLMKALAKEKDENRQEKMQEALAILLDIEKAKKSGYIPLKRWGNVGITVRMKNEDRDLVWYEHVDAKAKSGKEIMSVQDVKEKIEYLKKKFPDSDYEIDYFEITNFADVRAKIDLNELDALAANSDMSDEDYRALRDMLEDAIKRKGFRRHFYKAKDVPGYSEDFERAINDYVVSISSHLSRRMFAPKLDKAVLNIQKSGKKELFVYAKDYVSYINDPIEEFGNLRNIVFVYYLAGNIASGMTNLFQPIMTTVPILVQAVGGGAKISYEMARAYKDTMALMDYKEGMSLFNFDKAPSDVRLALQKADAEGDFIPLDTYQSMGIAGSKHIYLRGLDKRVRLIQEAVGLTFSIPERINRITTFVAAYRLAMMPENKQKIMSFIGRDQIARAKLQGKDGHAFAEAFADYAVTSSQFTMGKLNRPKIGRGIGTIPTQFLSFVMQSFELMYRMAKVHDGNKVAAIGLMLFTIIALSGLKGFPFAEDVEKILEYLIKKATKADFDFDKEMRGLLTPIFGKVGTDIIMEGVPYGALGVDMSTRLGFGNVIPDDGQGMLGVSFDMFVTRPKNALEFMFAGDYYKALAEIMPNFIKNPMHAQIWQEQGIKSQSTGLTIVAKEDVSKFDLWLKTAGFTSSKIAERRERFYMEQRISNAVNDLRNSYYRELSFIFAERIRESKINGPQSPKMYDYDQQIKAVFERIARYNEGQPAYKQINIDEDTLKDRINRELKGSDVVKGRKQAREEIGKVRELFKE